ncbi:MAG: glutathione S-transferase, partial [Proteobacteria bacterium]|nr:glutathione S-transferase [Pseudomonadota bacterium]
MADAKQPGLLLHHAAPSRSSTVLWMLEELGEPYRLHVMDLKAGENRKPEYLAINPMGKVPALEHDG